MRASSLVFSLGLLAREYCFSVGLATSMGQPVRNWV